MNILVVGSGAREHAIVRALSRSKKKPNIFCCGPSNNPGIKEISRAIWVGDICNSDEVIKKSREWEIDFAIIGPEAPLEKALADAFWKNSISVIGPKQKSAQIETNKAFARDLMKKYHIHGAPDYRVFHNLIGVKEFLQTLGNGNYVIKASGLMGGKGVKVAGDHLHSIDEAYHYCQALHDQNHSFVIEEKFIGQEFSLMCFCDGEHVVHMPVVQDHKRAFVGDKGPNTGGMGSYSDANHQLPFLTEDDVLTAQKINEAVIQALNQEYKEKYIGILYGSFIATKNGVNVIEFNARFGDPESLNVLAILESDFVEICQAMIAGNLSKEKVRFGNFATVCKYAVPEGYPDHPLKNSLIDVSQIKNPNQLYFSAVDFSEEKLIATGSRAVAFVGIEKTISEAEKIAEEEISRVQGKLFHREDIGTAELIQQRVLEMQGLR